MLKSEILNIEKQKVFSNQYIVFHITNYKKMFETVENELVSEKKLSNNFP